MNESIYSDPIYSLHRYFIWADRMRVHFDYILGNKSTNQNKQRFDETLYMSFWYAATYTIIEGWIELGLHDDKIDALLQSENVNLLRKYRNGVFHFRKNYFDEKKFMPFIRDGNKAVEWIRNLQEALSQFFLKYFSNDKHH
jgi:hypothetical protein